MLWYNELVSEFEVQNKIKHVVTDSVANIIKALLILPGFQCGTSSDNDNDDDEDGDELSSEAHLKPLDLENYSCFAHILQLVVKDGMAKAGPIDTVIKKCSKFVSFLRKSTIATDILEGTIRLQADNVTRWNSQLKMIKSVLSISSDIFIKLIELDGAPKLNSQDINLLQDIVEILEPFAEATDFVQVGCVPSSGYILPCIKGLQHHLKSMVSKYHSSFVIGLRQSLDKRMPYFEKKDAYIEAAALDSRFKLRWCSDEIEKQVSTELVKAEVDSISASGSTTTTAITTEPPKKKAKSCSLFSLMPSEASQIELDNTNTHIISDVDAYLEAPAVSMDTNPLNFWNKNSKKYLYWQY